MYEAYANIQCTIFITFIYYVCEHVHIWRSYGPALGVGSPIIGVQGLELRPTVLAASTSAH